MTGFEQAQAHFGAGVDAMNAGDVDGAMAAFRRVLALAPELPEAHVNLGLLLAERDPVLSEKHYQRAIASDPLRLDGYVHLGALLASHKRFAEAEASYRLALALDPHSAPALSNLGVLLACSGREAQAAACYRAAIAAAPGYQPARFNWSYLLLRNGEFAAGWRQFEGRGWYASFARHFDFPRWTGQPLAGASLMIAVEAGHGDMIQFCRYASLARRHGAARIGLVCHPGLKRLFATLAGVDVLYAVDEEIPRTGWDYWTPPLSMPLHFGTELATIPAPLPYLAPARADVARLAPMVDAAAGGLRVGLRVGVVWQGNPRFENDADRSIAALSTLAPLASLPNMRFFSLQKGASGSQQDAFPGLIDLAPLIGDFADTAALIDALDLVISVDTAVAHLAGALGKPVWVLLPAYKPDWRWLTGRDDSPWYPAVMRLFRQATAGDWDAVIARVRQALAAL
ncbi:MAG: hypothetical protein JWP59_63 [Massilia sp.]|nr:hypothetical protein [Massilia sp.]